MRDAYKILQQVEAMRERYEEYERERDRRQRERGWKPPWLIPPLVPGPRAVPPYPPEPAPTPPLAVRIICRTCRAVLYAGQWRRATFEPHLPGQGVLTLIEHARTHVNAEGVATLGFDLDVMAPL